MEKGKFISFEGIEGVGKSTTIYEVEKFLTQKNIQVYRTREPGGTEFGEKIRDLLLSKESIIPVDSELLLLFAIRYQHIKEVIEPKLNSGIWVLCDRFIDASFAYQGYGKKVNLEKIELLVENFTRKIIPDLTFFFNLSYDLAKKRFPESKTKDRFENLDDKFFEDVYLGYLELLKKNPDRIKNIDSKRNKEEVLKQITDVIMDCFKIK